MLMLMLLLLSHKGASTSLAFLHVNEGAMADEDGKCVAEPLALGQAEEDEDSCITCSQTTVALATSNMRYR